MRKSILCLCLVGVVLSTLAAQTEPLAVELAGVRWESSLEFARQRAQAENKPLLVLDMLGRLDERWC